MMPAIFCPGQSHVGIKQEEPPHRAGARQLMAKKQGSAVNVPQTRIAGHSVGSQSRGV
jgi:hypothetical protein